MILAFAIAALGGCGADLPPIEVTGLTPGWAYNGEPAKITVVGRNFYPSVTASSFAEPQVESQFRAWVETDPPTEVDYAVPTSLTTLEVQVPAGIEATEDGEDPYDFTVEASDGSRSTLPKAFTATPDRSAYLSASVHGDGTFVVGDGVTVDISLMNLGYQIEREDFEVNVVADSDDLDPSAVEFTPATLDHQANIVHGVQGNLLAGEGYVIVTSSEQGQVGLTISPAISNSIVAQTRVLITFGTDDVTGVSVEADDSAPILAGTPTPVTVKLRDEHDQVVEDIQKHITMYESCDASNYVEHDMTGPAQFPFALKRASGTDDCPENHVVVHVDGLQNDGQSAPITVIAGPPDRLAVTTSRSMTAGEPDGFAIVKMQDAYGNDLDSYETAGPDVVLEQNVATSADGPAPGVQSATCDAFDGGQADCTGVVLMRADPDVTITARDGSGRVGESEPFEVLTGPPVDIQVAPQLPVIQAGENLQVRVWVRDWPGNVIHVDGSELLLTDENQAPLVCQDDGIDPAIPFEVHVFECVFTQVGTHRVSVDMGSEGLFDFESSDIAVQNGDLDSISIDVGMTSVGAGVTFYADFVGTDHWGNPYVVQSDPDVQVTDASGTITPTLVHLDATGKASNQPMNVKRAALSNRLVATQDGTWLGSSPVFAITAGAFDTFFVDVDGPVVSIDDPGVVLVSAVDEYGNAIASYDQPVSLSSDSGFGNRITIESWVDGRAAVTFPFDTLGLQDSLEADDGVNHAYSNAFDVVDFHCPAGPTADLAVGSGLPLRLCLLPGMGATSFDLSGTVPGDESILWYYYLRGDGTSYRTGSSGWSTTWTQPGGYPVSGIVVDQAYCASESSGWAYVGYDDGQPVGDVSVSILGGATSVHAADGWVTVDVTAWTCAGDLAIGGTLLASVDNGSLIATGTSRASGSGIELGLSAFGETSIEWNMFGQPAGGIGTFVAGVRSGAAHGEVTLDIEGDSSHPTVLEVSPVGTLHDAVDTIAVLFSDPMLATSIDSTSVLLTDPSGTDIPIDDFTLSSSGPNAGRELVLDFPAQQGDVGAYTLTLTSALRKAPGPYDNANTLDGDYDASPAGMGDFVVSFGGVSDLAPDMLSCDPSTTLFRPDGDDTGTNPFEADVVDFDLDANGPAAFWLLEVFDPFGERVYMSHFVADDLDTGTVPWDGRNSDGNVLENGTYTVAVTAKDASWNEGAPCLADVTIDNLLAPVGE